MKSFSIASTPVLHFGVGKINSLPALLRNYGSSILLITGAKSFINSDVGKNFFESLSVIFNVNHFIIDREPTPEMIDRAVAKNKDRNIQVVVAIGGGSVVDAGKAISAMLAVKQSVKNFLEGVGTKSPDGRKLPFIAVPTTAGTGSEATKNAVISEVGLNGFKKSLRHDRYVPDVAIIDPQLMVNCTPAITAASGMDAFTQLLEAYLSTASNSFTDALAFEGLRLISNSLFRAYQEGTDLKARSEVALAAYYSGIVLANAGLGTIHGFASPIGGFFPIPHGVVCSLLMAPANKLTVRKLRQDDSSSEALIKYANVGRLFSQHKNKTDDYYVDSLLDEIAFMTKEMQIPSLSNYGITEKDFDKIVKATDNKNNPAKLDQNELLEILKMAF